MLLVFQFSYVSNKYYWSTRFPGCEPGPTTPFARSLTISSASARISIWYPFWTDIQSSRPGVLPGSQMNRQQAALPSGQRHQGRRGVEGHAADPMYRCESLQYNDPHKSSFLQVMIRQVLQIQYIPERINCDRSALQQRLS